MRGGELDAVYARRFPVSEQATKEHLWPPIVRFLERWIDPASPVLDIGCDRGYFIRNVSAPDRWATDLRDVRSELPHDIHFVRANGLELEVALPLGSFGTIFMSNYLEHLPSGDAVIEQLRVAARLLKPGGRVIVLQPNVRLVGGAYWDFIDHKVALTEKSLVEAGDLAGLQAQRVVTRFLPFTTKSRLPQSPRLVSAYLHVPLAWRFLGKQTLYIATGEP
jgi:SAM-dependent methyltransferase